MSVCVCVCVWSPGSLHWALTFMEPAGHVRAHNDPRERERGALGWGRGLRKCLGVWVLMEAWRRGIAVLRYVCVKLQKTKMLIKYIDFFLAN